VVGAAEPYGSVDDRPQHGVQVERRPRDRLDHVVDSRFSLLRVVKLQPKASDVGDQRGPGREAAIDRTRASSGQTRARRTQGGLGQRGDGQGPVGESAKSDLAGRRGAEEWGKVSVVRRVVMVPRVTAHVQAAAAARPSIKFLDLSTLPLAGFFVTPNGVPRTPDDRPFSPVGPATPTPARHVTVTSRSQLVDPVRSIERPRSGLSALCAGGSFRPGAGPPLRDRLA
jgi:hypothetical protein